MRRPSRALALSLLMASAPTVAGLSCHRTPAQSPDVAILGKPVTIAVAGEQLELIKAAAAAAPARAMDGPGLAVAIGGVHLKLLAEGAHDVLLPMPQMDAAQVPVTFAIAAEPAEAASALAIRQRAGGNYVVVATLQGAVGQEVRIEWGSVVLLGSEDSSATTDSAKQFCAATGCVQSRDATILAAAEDLWPADGNVSAYVNGAQQWIRQFKQQGQPLSLDAVGILKCKANWICTANANLGAALLRAKDIPARTLAVIPPTGQRLEMHRIVEFHQNDRWLRFDPSLLHRGVPMKPWQSIVMASTSIADENAAMQPRLGASVGSPYGQELELLDFGAMLHGGDFFWTEARPLATFEVSADAIDATRKRWQTFLASGKLPAGQVAPAAVTSAEEFLRSLPK